MNNDGRRKQGGASAGEGSKRPTHAQTERANDVMIIDTAAHDSAQGQKECLHDNMATDCTATYVELRYIAIAGNAIRRRSSCVYRSGRVARMQTL